ncbi:MAG TPA: PH domain-containing protein [Clostridia bacterium]|nr:PH domain-containing protein [Clostridia bacterium]
MDENLIEGEVVLYRTTLHWIVLVAPMTIAAVIGFGGLMALFASLATLGDKNGTAGGLATVSLVLILIAAAIAGLATWHRSSTEMAVTNKRVMIKVGMISRRTTEITLQKIESVGVDQGLLARLMNYGSIVVRGTGGTPEPFSKISHPLEFRRQVQQQIDKLLAVAANA